MTRGDEIKRNFVLWLQKEIGYPASELQKEFGISRARVYQIYHYVNFMIKVNPAWNVYAQLYAGTSAKL